MPELPEATLAERVIETGKQAVLQGFVQSCYKQGSNTGAELTAMRYGNPRDPELRQSSQFLTFDEVHSDVPPGLSQSQREAYKALPESDRTAFSQSFDRLNQTQKETFLKLGPAEQMNFVRVEHRIANLQAYTEQDLPGLHLGNISRSEKSALMALTTDDDRSNLRKMALTLAAGPDQADFQSLCTEMGKRTGQNDYKVEEMQRYFCQLGGALKGVRSDELKSFVMPIRNIEGALMTSGIGIGVDGRYIWSSTNPDQQPVEVSQTKDRNGTTVRVKVYQNDVSEVAQSIRELWRKH